MQNDKYPSNDGSQRQAIIKLIGKNIEIRDSDDAGDPYLC